MKYKGKMKFELVVEVEGEADMGFMTMSKLLSDYTFTDGSLCGVEE